MGLTIDYLQKDKYEGTKLHIMEIFSSIQGEGALIGMPVTFIRLQGCNLKCPFCDTKKSWAFRGDKAMSIIDILEKVTENTVIITGGEPCVQKENLEVLIEALHYNNIFVGIETNGTLPLPEGLDWATCSPKLDSKGMFIDGEERGAYYIHPDNLPKIGEYKFVVDADFDVKSIPADLMALPKGSIWLQPESSDMTKNMKRCYDLAMEHGLRAGIQLHKIMGVE